jgi:hypothetical protein
MSFWRKLTPKKMKNIKSNILQLINKDRKKKLTGSQRNKLSKHLDQRHRDRSKVRTNKKSVLVEDLEGLVMRKGFMIDFKDSLFKRLK